MSMTNPRRLTPQIHFGAMVIVTLLLSLPALAQQDPAVRRAQHGHDLLTFLRPRHRT
jgi:hypothetical protein